MRLSNIIQAGVVAGLLSAGSMTAFADAIGPLGCVGGFCGGTLDIFSNLPGTRLASATDSSWWANDDHGNPSYGGVLRSAVYRNAANTLDFYYQFSNSRASLASISRLTMTNFAGFTTNVGYRMDDWDNEGQFLAGQQAAISADRSLSGGTIGFSFAPFFFGSGGNIDPRETSATLVIRTNAYAFTKAGSLTAQDCADYTTAAFAPTTGSAVPEPGTYMMMGTGLIALFALRRRK
jgi:hypothetical protein